jgi:hypothetical protein
VNFKSIAVALIIAALLAGAAWRLWPVQTAPEKAAVALQPPAPTEAADIPADPPPSDEKPAVAEVTATAIDPQAELHTAIADYLGLLQRGDMEAVMKNYTPPATPEQPRQGLAEGMALALALYETMKQDPQQQQILDQTTQRKVAEMQSIQDTTPTYDETGDYATYALPAGSSKPSIAFVRVNGRWYRDIQ